MLTEMSKIALPILNTFSKYLMGWFLKRAQIIFTKEGEKFKLEFKNLIYLPTLFLSEKVNWSVEVSQEAGGIAKFQILMEVEHPWF